MRLLWPGLVDMLFPRTCAGCGEGIEERGLHVCWDCRAALAVIGHPLCQTCGEPVHGRVDHSYVCHGCVKHPPRYRQARAAIHYNRVGKRLVTQYKYNQALWIEHYLVDLLEACVGTHFGRDAVDAVCAVPLHPAKQRRRGYNQSLLLAQALAKRIGKPLVGTGSLCRTRATATQTRLTAGQRTSNVRGAFSIRRPRDFAGKAILLVDDVLTTGATVSSCAGVLLEAGATSVDVVTVARGM